VLINAALAAKSTTGGRLFFKNGVYNINSMTLESATGCNNFEGVAAIAYGIGLPSNTTLANSVQWLFEGESTTVWQGELVGATVNNAGVIFEITPTAVSSVAAGTILAGFWQRPITNCTTNTTNTSNDAHYKNMTVRFPLHTRGNEIGIAAYFNLNIEYENVVADFNELQSALKATAPLPGTYGSFGLTTTTSISGNYQYFKNTFVSGWHRGYDFQSEHIVSEQSTAIYSNSPGIFGRSMGAVNYASQIIQFDDQENLNGFIFGSNMSTNSRVDFLGLQIELLNDATWYSVRACTGAMTETTPGITTGLIYYVASCGVPLSLPPANLFSSGGQSFQAFSGAVPHFIAQVPGSDTFTRPNSANLGSGWTNCPGCALFGIVSNSATSSAYNIAYFTALTSNNDQFSRATVNTIDASGVAVEVRGSLTALTYYEYQCTNATRLIRKRVAGAFTTLATALSGGCAVGDIIELDAIGPNLYAYLTHSSIKTLDITGTDSAIASGYPGVASFALTDSLTNWFGTSLPTSRYSNSSLFTPDSTYGIPQKQFVFTADYTNATTGMTNVVGVGNAGQGLGFPVAANTSYTMTCDVLWSASAATAGPQFQITGPAAPTAVQYSVMQAVTATTDGTAGATAFSTALNASGATVVSATNEPARITMSLLNGANAGTIQLQAAAQGAGTLTIRQGSSCTLQ
jgi:hypothetical protein